MNSRFKGSTSCLKNNSDTNIPTALSFSQIIILNILSVFCFRLLLKTNVNCKQLPLIWSMCWKMPVSCFHDFQILFIYQGKHLEMLLCVNMNKDSCLHHNYLQLRIHYINLYGITFQFSTISCYLKTAQFVFIFFSRPLIGNLV